MLASAATLLAAARAGRVPMLTRSSFSTLHARYESSTPPPHVGFVGLGQIGARLARRLADRGHALRVLDTDPSAVDAFMSSVPPSQRVARAASLAELSASCGAVITSLPTLSAVRAAWQGEGGLLAGAGPASPLKVGVDISTTGPAYGRELASAASEVRIGCEEGGGGHGF
jgi:3-hydroxyisobutyrate dehydrogenase